MLAPLPQLSALYSGPLVLLFPILLLFVSFGRINGQLFGRMLVYCYLLSFAMNGITAAGNTIFVELGLGGEIFSIIFLPSILVLIIGRATVGYFKEQIGRDSCFADGLVEFAGSKAELAVFLDTGNNLTEPVSGLPVMIVEYNSVAQILPKELKDEYEKRKFSNGSLVEFLYLVGEKYPNADWFGRLHLLSYRSVGKEQGFLLGFRPNYLQIKDKKLNVVLALYDGKLGGKRAFSAIINPWALESNQPIKSLKRVV